MEAATALEVASGSTLKVKEMSPADAEGPPASSQQESGSPIPQLLSPIEEHPKIWLPRTLRQTYICKVGDTVNLLIPFQGKPKPRATWKHDGCALDASRRGQVLLRVSSWWTFGAPVLLWSGHLPKTRATRHSWDTPCRRLTQNLGCGSRCWSVIIAPASRSPTSSWATPTHFESLLRTSVGSVRQPPSLLTLPTSRKQVGPGARELGSVEAEELKRGGDLGHYVIGPLVPSATVCKTEGFAQRDFSEAPKFTQPLADCTTVTGYDTQLFCCVRGSPKPKIIWLKNKMDIQGNPKYRALSYLGICSLEIRKPGPFDGGIYTCKAVNPLGEASVDCRVDVKGKGRTHPLSPQGDNSGMEPQACR
ncbi:myosin-binding protein H-like isoform X2 [Ursus maritimus]|uniref:Myosin-binding protein H-like isoform X2 n=1 Tax=Ursus maritimus TaxID=29073 RepID=A0A8M1FHM7_URSMA|nr:myosin-binding protein H-like isoform X2 [Ursus maritimus]